MPDNEKDQIQIAVENLSKATEQYFDGVITLTQLNIYALTVSIAIANRLGEEER